MANKLAKPGMTGRDLIAAVRLGPGPALVAAVDQLAGLDDDGGRSRMSQSELRQLAQHLIQNTHASVRLEILEFLVSHPSHTARALCVFALPHVWDQEKCLFFNVIW